MHGGARINEAKRLCRQPMPPLEPAARGRPGGGTAGHDLAPPTQRGGRLNYLKKRAEHRQIPLPSYNTHPKAGVVWFHPFS